MTTKKILIPLDGSTFSYEILPYIQTFFQPANYELIILHVASPSSEVQKKADIVAQVEEQFYQTQHDFEAAGYQIKLEIKFGYEPVEEILATIKDQNIDLMAITTHGRTRLKRLLFGSVAEALLQDLPIPTFLIKPVGEMAEVEGEPVLQDVFN